MAACESAPREGEVVYVFALCCKKPYCFHLAHRLGASCRRPERFRQKPGLRGEASGAPPRLLAGPEGGPSEENAPAQPAACGGESRAGRLPMSGAASCRKWPSGSHRAGRPRGGPGPAGPGGLVRLRSGPAGVGPTSSGATRSWPSGSSEAGGCEARRCRGAGRGVVRVSPGARGPRGVKLKCCVGCWPGQRVAEKTVPEAAAGEEVRGWWEAGRQGRPWVTCVQVKFCVSLFWSVFLLVLARGFLFVYARGYLGHQNVVCLLQWPGGSQM